MTTFDEREDTFEKKFKHDQELRFKIHARRNKLFGQWAAARLGLGPAEAESYARAVVAAEVRTPGQDAALHMVRKDLTAKGISASEAELRREIERLAGLAKEQLAKPG